MNEIGPSQEDAGIKVKKRGSWIGGGSRPQSKSRSRNGSRDLDKVTKPSAWIDTPNGIVDYSLEYLLHDKVTRTRFRCGKKI